MNDAGLLLLPDDIRKAVLDARERTEDPTITVRCEAERWRIERDGEFVAGDHGQDTIVSEIAALP